MSSTSRHPRMRLLAACAVLMHSAVLAAETPNSRTDRIVTDRPDVVESSEVVGRGRFQIETSIDYERDRNAGTKTRTTTTPTLFRLGVTDTVELRVETDGHIRERTGSGLTSSTETGWTDAAIGLKWHMQDGDEQSRRPAIGWLIHADLDSGSARFRGQGIRPSVRVVFEWELPRDMSFGLMPGIIRDKDPGTGERYTAGILAAVIGKELNDRARVFVELAATQIARQKHGGTVATFDLGAAYLLTRLVQLDVAARLGLNGNTPDFGATVGLSVKF